jgi:hypothetical protein
VLKATVVEHLLDFVDRYVRGSSPALVYDDGFRQWSYTNDELRATADAWASELVRAGLGPVPVETARRAPDAAA